MVYVGVLLFVVKFVFQKGGGNTLSLCGLTLIVAGTLLYIWNEKHDARY